MIESPNYQCYKRVMKNIIGQNFLFVDCNIVKIIKLDNKNFFKLSNNVKVEAFYSVK